MPRGQYDRKAAQAKRAAKAEASRKSRQRKALPAAAQSPIYLEDRVARLEKIFAAIAETLAS